MIATWPKWLGALLTSFLLTGVPAATIYFTSAKSYLRPTIFILMLIAIFSTAYRITGSVSRNVYASFLVSNSLGICLQYFDTVLLSRWSYEAGGPTSGLGGLRPVHTIPKDDFKWNSKPKSRLAFALYASHDSRMIDSPWEVKSVPHFSKAGSAWVPSRVEFVKANLSQILVGLVILDGFWLLSKMADAEEKKVVSNPRQNGGLRFPGLIAVASLTDLSLETLTQKALTMILVRLAMIQIVVVLHSCLAVATVITNIYAPHNWRPIFGSVRDCWSVRQFWGVFWQQNMRQRLCAPAHFITFSILSLEKGTLISRYTLMFFTFLVSGIFHGLISFYVGLNGSLDIGFYLMQALAIMMEDIVQFLFFKWKKQAKNGQPNLERWCRRLGYVWVLLWFTLCSTPPPDWSAKKQIHQEWEKLLPFELFSRYFKEKNMSGSL